MRDIRTLCDQGNQVCNPRGLFGPIRLRGFKLRQRPNLNSHSLCSTALTRTSVYSVSRYVKVIIMNTSYFPKSIAWEVDSGLDPKPGRFAWELETLEMILTPGYALHINRAHVNQCRSQEKSQFKSCFNLTCTLAFLTKQTFSSHVNFIVDRHGWNKRHYNYYRYVFNVNKVVGFAPYGYLVSK